MSDWSGSKETTVRLNKKEHHEHKSNHIINLEDQTRYHSKLGDGQMTSANGHLLLHRALRRGLGAYADCAGLLLEELPEFEALISS